MSTAPGSSDRDLQKVALARELISLWMGLFKSLHLYEWKHDAVRAMADRVRAKIHEITEGEGDLDLAARSGSIFVDRMRIRESASTGSSYHQLADLLQRARVASVQLDSEV